MFIFRYIIVFIAAATILLLTGCVYATDAVAPGEYSSSDFTRAGKCQLCHAIVHSQWDGTMHSNAYKDPFYQKEFHAASIDTDGLVDDFCSRCHTPIGVLSGEIPPADAGPRIHGFCGIDGPGSVDNDPDNYRLI